MKSNGEAPATPARLQNGVGTNPTKQLNQTKPGYPAATGQAKPNNLQNGYNNPVLGPPNHRPQPGTTTERPENVICQIL